MNTANLQMEGLLLALGSLMRALQEKGLLSDAEIQQMLREAATRAASDARPEGLSPANVNAVMFPIRFLEQDLAGTEPESYSKVAAAVARDRHG
ncbi:MAG: hypothetical protein ACXIVF_04615 [Rhizobiaceae bacterium]